MKSAHNISRTVFSIIGAIVIIGIIAGISYYLTPSAAKENYTTTPVTRMDLTQAVTATGQVAPDQTSILAFDQLGGTIDQVNVAVGDHVTKGEILATLESDILQSSLAGAQADVAAAQAQLAVLQEGAKPADVAVYSQKSADAETALSSAIHDAYLKTENAIEDQTDTFFTNAVTPNPILNVPTQSIPIQLNINQERLVLGGDLTNWQSALASDAPNQVTAKSQTEATASLADAKKFLSDLSNIVNYLTPYNSGYTQTQIDADRAIVTSAATEVTAAATEYNAALSGVNEANSALTLEQSSATPSTIAAQTAQVDKAQAEVDADESQINHSALVAPFDGIVTDVEATKGDVFALGVPAITVISDNPFKIDIEVSETDVAKLTLGSPAKVTLDAYGSDKPFPATVTTIDPARTTVSGVNSYEVTLHFANTDPRILPGMTANVSIATASSSNVLAVPVGDIITRGADTFVLVKNKNGSSNSFSEKQVTTGITGTNGYIEITSGLSDGDTVASF